MALLFSPQMGAGQAFNSQFLQHGSPRGPSLPSTMNPAGLGGLTGPMGMNPTRAAGMASLYTGQRLPQQGYPGPPQAQPLPRQGVKRAYSNEVSVRASLILSTIWSHKRLGVCERTGHASQGGRCCPSREPVSPTPPFPRALASFPLQVYPGQQYLPGGQYAPNTTQYAPGTGQPPGPSYSGHRLPMQQGVGPALPTSGPVGLNYKVGPVSQAAAVVSGPCWGSQMGLRQSALAGEWASMPTG